MDITHIQISLDIATAVSIIGAACVFIYNDVRESKKTRAERRRMWGMERRGELVEFLNGKSVKAAEINNSIKRVLDPRNDANLISLSRDSELLTSIPQSIAITPFIVELEEKVLSPIRLKLELYPYRNFLSVKVKKELDEMLKFVNQYISTEPTSICGRLRTPELIAHFVFFLEREGIITNDVHASLLSKETYLQEIMTEFDRLEEAEKVNLRFSFLKGVKLENLENRHLWEDIPRKLQASARTIVQSFDDEE